MKAPFIGQNIADLWHHRGGYLHGEGVLQISFAGFAALSIGRTAAMIASDHPHLSIAGIPR
jgi:hypothetical protein